LLEDFHRRTGNQIEVIDPDEDPSFVEAYDVVEYPTVMALGPSGETVYTWKGQPLPLFDEISYYVNA